MAALTSRVLYCDETQTNGGGPFFLGALACSRYDVHLDHLQAKRWRWDSLKYALRRAAVRDDYVAGRGHIPRLRAEDSKTSNQLQLVDVAHGASTGRPASPYKAAFQERVRQRMAERVTAWTFVREAQGGSLTATSM